MPRRLLGIFPRASPLLVTTLGLVAAACGARDGLPVGGGTGGARTCASRTFAPETSYAVGALPSALAVGDFNGDGHLDVVVTNSANGAGSTVSVLLGTGAGSFGAQTVFPVELGPWSVAVGDFDGDGHPDLVTSNSGAGTVSVLLGTGAGGFGPQTTFAAGPDPTSLVVGDFNGDGHLDLAVVNSDDSVRVLLGTGTGSFGAPTAFAVAAPPWSVTAGDFDGDGHLDLAVAGGNDGPSAVDVLLGTGTGSFGSPASFAVGRGPTTVTVGDFDGDGHLDLVAANYSDDTVSVLLGTGTGSFGPQTAFAAGPGPISVAVADFDGDGHLDLATANLDDDTGTTVSVVSGTGTGSFGSPTALAVGASPSAVTVGDFNGDGHPDLAVAIGSEIGSTSPDGKVGILLDVCGGAGG